MSDLRRFLADLVYEKIVDHAGMDATSDSYRCADAIIFSGRLVDREAIDNEAAAHALFIAVQQRLAAMFDGPAMDWDTEWDSEAVALVKAYRDEARIAVAAAIGDIG